MLGVGAAHAAVNKLLSCSGTATSSSADITFSQVPTSYLAISNPHASNTLWVNFVGGAAAANTAGSMSIAPGEKIWFNTETIPGAAKIIAPAGNTAYTCMYR